MKDRDETIVRIAAAVLCFGLILPMFALGGWAGGDGAGGAVLGFLAALLMFSLGAALVAPTIVEWSSSSWGGLLFPNAHYEKAPPHYSLAEAKAKKGRFEEALGAYVKMTLEYPDEVRPYIEMLGIILLHLQDAERAEAVFQKGMSNLKRREDQETLQRMYDALCSQARERPEWGQVHTLPLDVKPDDYRPPFRREGYFDSPGDQL